MKYFQTDNKKDSNYRFSSRLEKLIIPLIDSVKILRKGIAGFPATVASSCTLLASGSGPLHISVIVLAADLGINPAFACAEASADSKAAIRDSRSIVPQTESANLVRNCGSINTRSASHFKCLGID